MHTIPPLSERLRKVLDDLEKITLEMEVANSNADGKNFF